MQEKDVGLGRHAARHHMYGPCKLFLFFFPKTKSQLKIKINNYVIQIPTFYSATMCLKMHSNPN